MIQTQVTFGGSSTIVAENVNGDVKPYSDIHLSKIYYTDFPMTLHLDLYRADGNSLQTPDHNWLGDIFFKCLLAITSTLINNNINK